MAHHPECCSPLDDRWPWPHPLPGVCLYSTRYDPAALSQSDFQGCGIARPDTLSNAVAKRQAEYLAGRLCARQALAKVAGQPVVPAIGDDRAPQWPDHCVGSITHGDGWAGALVGSRDHHRGLGLDAETLIPDSRATKLARQILTPAERERFSAVLAATPGKLVTLTFSLKESLFKALYPIVLKRFYFEHAELVDWSNDGSARIRLLTDLSPEWCHGREFDAQFTEHEDKLLSLVWIPAV